MECKNLDRPIEIRVVVGQKNIITLPLVGDEIFKTIGEKIAEGDYTAVYRLKGSFPPRVYKIIHCNRFRNGNEIRFLEIAARAGVAPTFHRAFVAKYKAATHERDQYVFIEMDEAGQSWDKWREKLAEERRSQGNQEEGAMSAELRAARELIEKIEAQLDAERDSFAPNVMRKRISSKKAIEKLFGSQEAFYYELFSKLKTLAENNIVYDDAHEGNIVIDGKKKKLLLIDFGKAEKVANVSLAASQMMQSVYNRFYYNHFSSLPNLSAESKELIKWFSSQPQSASKL